MLTKWMKQSLTYRVAVWVAVVQLAVSLVVYVPGVVLIRNIMTDRQAAGIQQVVQRLSAFGNSYVDTLNSEVRQLGRGLLLGFNGQWGVDSTGSLTLNGAALTGLNERLDRMQVTPGVSVTVFARKGDEFVRIATTLRNEEGQRAVNTTLSHDSPAYTALLGGQGYSGMAQLFGKEVAVDYEPLHDAQGQVIGCFYVGESAESALEHMVSQLASSKVGHTGFVGFVLLNQPGHATALHFPGHEQGNLYEDPALARWFQGLNGHDAGVVDYADAEGAHVLSYQKLDAVPVYVLVSQTQSEFGEVVRWVTEIILLGVMVLLAGCAPVILRLLKKTIQEPLQQTVNYFDRMAEGELDSVITVTGVDEVGRLLLGLSRMQAGLKEIRAKEQQTLEHTVRVVSALDSSSANVIIADKEGVIVYVNRSFVRTFRHRQQEIRKVLPLFDVDKVVGSNIDVFHKNPGHQRHLLKTVTDTYRSNIKIADLHFLLTLNPIRAEGQAEASGYVVEWLDRTQEALVEQEIDEVMQAVIGGDLTARLGVEGKAGFFLSLSQGINELVQVIEGMLSDVARVLQGLAQGRLDSHIDNQYQGVFGQLREDSNRSLAQLADVVRQIRESAQAVARGASEIAQGNQDLSQRTEEQASSLQETASSMEEMTSVVKQTAENAARVNTLATTTRDRAQAAGQVVERAIGAMEAINSASKRIADIIGVIDEIAFQTNLLALNAAVEAARAGEQGRGFAVVAGEVRNLAQRSAAAAREIKDLIRDSVVKVEDGSELVLTSGKTLQDIVQAVERVSSMISDISSAAQEQSMGIEQVNVAVSQMDQMTQQNAALVEEAAAAGESMSEQARTMLGVVQFFKLSERSGEDFVLHPKVVAEVGRTVRAGLKQEAGDWDEF